MYPKLYVVTRGDLAPGHQATQSVHAALQFSQDYPTLCSRWFVGSSFLVLLDGGPLEALESLLERLRTARVLFSAWREPDWEMQLTAVAIEPGLRTSKLLAQYPLLLRSEYPVVAEKVPVL